MKETSPGLFIRFPLLTFFVLVLVFTWLILSPGVAANLGWIKFEFDGTVLTILGGLGPLLAAIVVSAANDGRAGVTVIIQRMFDRKVKIKWWIASILLIAGLFGLAAAINSLTGGASPDPRAGIYLNGGNLILVLLLLFVGSFGEEPGWRGFALPILQKRYKPLKATLILTLIWWLWHIPTYWTMPLAMNAVEQYGFVAAFGIQFVVLLALGILCAWVFNGSGGSILMPVLIHAGWNFWSGTFGQEAATFLMPLFLLTAIVVGIVTRGKLGFSPEEDHKER